MRARPPALSQPISALAKLSTFCIGSRGSGGAALLRAGLPEAALPVCTSELEAARRALEWARPGDVLVLPVHSPAARAAVLAMLGQPAAGATVDA